MWIRAQRWLRNIPLHDPIDSQIAPTVQIMLIGVAICSVLGGLFWFLSPRSLVEGLWVVVVTLLIVFFSSLALILLRRGNLPVAVLVGTTGLLFGLGFNLIGLGLSAGAGVLAAFLLPVALAGFLAGRRGLVFTILLSLALISGVAMIELRAPDLIGFGQAHKLSLDATVLDFAFVASLLGLLIDSFSQIVRNALKQALAREKELEHIRASLEARTTELSNAKEALESELAVRMRAEQALAFERDLLHALMDNIPDTIYFKDTASRFTRINRAQAQLLGLADPSGAVGKTDFDFFPAEELAQGFYDEEQKIVATGEPLIDRVEFNPTSDGQARWLSATKVPIKGPGGQVVGIAGISRDITARQEIDRLKSEFIATVSHELRTPLTSICGSLGLLAGGAAGELPLAARSMIDIAYKNSQRLTRLINDILDIERIESGALTFALTPVDLPHLVGQAIEANQGYAAQYHVHFALLRNVPQARVLGDADRLMQVFTNLLSNAAKFSPSDSTVEVAIDRCERTFRVSITDHGSGIPEAFRARIFGKFAQADGSDMRQKGGAGLGLSIAKALVERQGGQIGFMSASQQGTTFYVDLPEL